MNYFRERMSEGIGTKEEQIAKLKKALTSAESIVIGAGAGLSTSAGFTYSGERFNKYFFEKNTGLVIYTPVDFILFRMQRQGGAGGQGIFTLTVMSMHLSLFIRNCYL